MKKLLLLLATVTLLGCGSTFIENPIPPNLEECYLIEKQFVSGIKETAFPIPFTGSREISLYTDKPRKWSDFNGSVHLKKLSWNVDWISKIAVILDGIVIARWEHESWETSALVNLKPHIGTSQEDSDRLEFEVTLKGKGTKPASYFQIEVESEIWICGENAELILPDVVEI